MSDERRVTVQGTLTILQVAADSVDGKLKAGFNRARDRLLLRTATAYSVDEAFLRLSERSLDVLPSCFTLAQDGGVRRRKRGLTSLCNLEEENVVSGF